jgi:hypothetical protein
MIGTALAAPEKRMDRAKAALVKTVDLDMLSTSLSLGIIVVPNNHAKNNPIR